MTIFDRNDFDHPVKGLAYGGGGGTMRRLLGSEVYRLQRGKPVHRPLTKQIVQALPQFNSLPIQSPTKDNAGPFVYTTAGEIRRPNRLGVGQALP